MQQVAKDLRAVVTKAAGQMRQVGEKDAAQKPGSEEWSNKQVLGHLIDSASNNHQRFIRAQRSESHDFPGYDQNDWVALQAYQTKPWTQLVTLWEVLNLHLADIIEWIPESKLSTECTIAGKPWTLGEIVVGYFGHMQAHLDDLPVDVSDIKRYPYPRG
ncbi:MAG: DinB family protein [Anaerolineae bacterium]|nr:DinB family protein [Anaerolineae bacterium]